MAMVSGKKDAAVPTVNISAPGAAAAVAEACRSIGFFRVTNNGVPAALAAALEARAMDFFALPVKDKELHLRPPSSLDYKSKVIGNNGDFGWLEHFMLSIDSGSVGMSSLPTPLRVALDEYTGAMRQVSDSVLAMIVEALGVDMEDCEVVRGMLDGGKDEIVRVNHYPPGRPLGTGFGEHTDPQIMSLLWSNLTPGFEIKLNDREWHPVAPDRDALFVIVGDSLQVLTNGRFRSVEHRVVAPEGTLSRLSIIYFVSPSKSQRIVPVPKLMKEGEQSLYREFTWGEYKNAANKTRLGYCRLADFEAPNAHDH